MKQDAVFYDNDFRRSNGAYSTGQYAERNIEAAKKLKKYKPINVIELAGAEGHLAYVMLIQCPTIRKYFWSDFCDEAIELGTNKLMSKHMLYSGLSDKVTIRKIDADDLYNLDSINFHEYDTYLCTASEHFHNDLEVLKRLKQGTLVYLCLPNFPWGGHVRYFESMEQLKDRYADLIDIKESWINEAERKRKFSYFLRDWLKNHKNNRVVSYIFDDLLHAVLLNHPMKFNIIGLKK